MSLRARRSPRLLVSGLLLAAAAGLARPAGAVPLFAAPQVAVGAEPRALALADLDGDGRLDAAVASAGDGGVSVLLGAGDGTFVPHAVVDVGGQPRTVAVADFDGDGIPDPAVGDYRGSRLVVVRGTGGGRFADPAPRVHALTGAPQDLAADDLTGDGRPDVVVALAVRAAVVLDTPGPLT